MVEKEKLLQPEPNTRLLCQRQRDHILRIYICCFKPEPGKAQDTICQFCVWQQDGSLPADKRNSSSLRKCCRTCSLYSSTVFRQPQFVLMAQKCDKECSKGVKLKDNFLLVPNRWSYLVIPQYAFVVRTGKIYL